MLWGSGLGQVFSTDLGAEEMLRQVLWGPSRLYQEFRVFGFRFRV